MSANEPFCTTPFAVFIASVMLGDVEGKQTVSKIYYAAFTASPAYIKHPGSQGRKGAEADMTPLPSPTWRDPPRRVVL